MADIQQTEKKKKKDKGLSKKQFVVSIVGISMAGILVLGLLFVALFGDSLAGKLSKDRDASEESAKQEAVVDKGLTPEDMSSANERYNASLELDQAWKSMWLSEMELGENPADFATINSCEIYSGDASKVHVTGVLPGIPKADSDSIYLFELDTFATGIPDGAEPIGTYRIERTEPSFEFFANLNFKQASSRLYKKFVVAAKVNDSYEIISSSRYINNPEMVAKYNSHKSSSGIKGLLIDPLKITSGELDDLGVQQAVYNIPMRNLMGGGVTYDYGGKTYSFNAGELQVFDKIFSTLSAKGIQVTAVLLNNDSSCAALKHPNASGGAPYNMFNSSNRDGVDAMAAMASFLADRYSGKGHGLISNWVVGNEINMRKEWNNYSNVDVDSYTRVYADGFRVIYNAIKSTNSAANVYMPLDQTWNRNRNDGDYDGRDVLDSFAAYISKKGDIDWGLAYHPYPVPLTNARFWNTGSFSKYTTYSVDTEMVSMHNLYIVTDYLCQERFRMRNKEVRSVILSEEGYTSTSGEDVQAAAYAYAYYIAENNQYIDGFMISRETDAASEVAQGLALGLTTPGGGRKKVYNVFKHINKADGHDYTDFALPIIGAGSWSEIIRQH